MRQFIGHTVKVAAEQIGVVEGTMVDDKPSLILVQGKDKKITRVVKSHICGFLPTDFEPFEYIPFHVLFCENKRTKCPGVQYIKKGEGFTREDVEVFVGPCPCRAEDCSMGTKGELRSVSGKFLENMLNETMFGEYPKKGGGSGNKDDAGRDGQIAGAGAAAPKGKRKGRGIEPGKEPDNGGIGGTPEPTQGTGSQE